jgi:hypothetical protein
MTPTPTAGIRPPNCHDVDVDPPWLGLVGNPSETRARSGRQVGLDQNLYILLKIYIDTAASEIKMQPCSPAKRGALVNTRAVCRWELRQRIDRSVSKAISVNRFLEIPNSHSPA